jgi:hypothetical protein
MDHYENYRDNERIADVYGNIQNEGYGRGVGIAILIAVGLVLLILATSAVQVTPYTASPRISEAPISPPPTLPIPEPPKT